MKRFVLLAVLCLHLPIAALAQEQRGSIEGTVRDSSGAVLPGVTVEARSPAIAGVADHGDRHDGTYRFPALPTGPLRSDGHAAGISSRPSRRTCGSSSARF